MGVRRNKLYHPVKAITLNRITKIMAIRVFLNDLGFCSDKDMVSKNMVSKSDGSGKKS